MSAGISDGHHWIWRDSPDGDVRQLQYAPRWYGYAGETPDGMRIQIAIGPAMDPIWVPQVHVQPRPFHPGETFDMPLVASWDHHPQVWDWKQVLPEWADEDVSVIKPAPKAPF